MALGNQRLEAVKLSKELEKLEKIIQIETKSGDYSYFNGYSQPAIEECNAKFDISLFIDNDSIIEKGVELYVNSVSKRVNEKLINKKCIDSIVIHTSYDCNKEKTDSLKTKYCRYSFPVKKGVLQKKNTKRVTQ